MPFTCGGVGVRRNWLFSQYINILQAKEIFLEVSYRFADCYILPEGFCNANYVTLYRQDVNNTLSYDNIIDDSRYQPILGNESNSRLGHNSLADFMEPTIEKRMKLDLPQTNGFYLGLLDAGTCGFITRLVIYYTICKGHKTDLVIYPEVATPPVDGPDESYEAECVPNAHNTTSLHVNMLSATSTCVDEAVGGARCECNAGYEKDGTDPSCICKPIYYLWIFS